jgi:hypothetical protein
MLNTSLPSERTEVYPGPGSTSSRISLSWPLGALKMAKFSTSIGLQLVTTDQRFSVPTRVVRLLSRYDQN